MHIETIKKRFLGTKSAATKMSENANNWGEYANRHFHRRCWRVSWHYPFGRQYYPARLGAGRSSSPGFMLLEKLVWVRTPRTQVQGMVPTPWFAEPERARRKPSARLQRSERVKCVEQPPQRGALLAAGGSLKPC